MSLQRLHCASREAWLDERKMHGIGGSEAAAVVGLSPWLTALGLWKQKTGRERAADLSGNEAVDRGNRFEPALRELFKAMHPEYMVEYHQFDILYQDELPFVFATLDGEYYRPNSPERRRVLEIKTCTPNGKANWEEWKYGVPKHYYIQILAQMLATGYDGVTLLAALFNQAGDIITIKEYEFDRADCEADLEWLKGELARFWGYVQSDRMPPQPLTM